MKITSLKLRDSIRVYNAPVTAIMVDNNTSITFENGFFVIDHKLALVRTMVPISNVVWAETQKPEKEKAVELPVSYLKKKKAA